MPGPIVFTEKCCQYCGKINYDSDTQRSYGEDCTSSKNPSENGKCDINGEVRNYDAKNIRVY